MVPLQILLLDAHEIISSPYTILQTLEVEENIGNISNSFLIDISVMKGIVENIHIRANRNTEEIVSFTYPFKDFRDVLPWSYEEMHGIDPSIVKHEIKKCQAFFLWYFSCSLI